MTPTADDVDDHKWVWILFQRRHQVKVGHAAAECGPQSFGEIFRTAATRQIFHGETPMPALMPHSSRSHDQEHCVVHQLDPQLSGRV